MVAAEDFEKNMIYRIIDANTNRCAEGLRVVEEIARFELEERKLVEELKEIRHSVRRVVLSFGKGFINFRNIEGDVGKDFSTQSELKRSKLSDIAKANFSRVEEALRVIEEFSKLIDKEASVRFKEFRFRLYRLEKVFFEETINRKMLPQCPFVYAVLDRSIVEGKDIERVAEELVAGGVGMIQYLSLIHI